ncbi:7231_t:CDS:2 [Paraglomus occultum]|uniref:DNA-directed RNA polymerases I, II, and III subunit RPABC1 n=1 Tax=Paraglomus occultum TaxID=144539 RepID=A0A9N9G0G1_9GLOM|nr:7231_t:CDS:2 [Paraglomus occultum]
MASSTHTTEDVQLSIVQSSPNPVYELYPHRWYGLTLLFFLNLTNNLYWLTFAPVTEISANYLAVSDTAVTLLGTIFLIVFVIMSPCAGFMLDRWGLRKSLLFGAFLSALGGWIRYSGCLVNAVKGRYAIIIIGQIVCAVSNCIFLTAPTNFAMTWFSDGGRTTANMVGSVANPLGGAVAQILIPSVVTEESRLPLALILTASIATVTAIPVLFLRDKPPSYPSFSASQPPEKFGSGFKKLLTNWNFLVIWIAFTTIVGFFSAFLILMNDILSPYGYDETKSGIIGAVTILSGLVGAGISGPLIDKTKAYKTLIKSVTPVVGVGFFLLPFVVRENAYAEIAIVCSLIGFLSFSLLPVALEIGVECTFPVSANTSAAILWLGGQGGGVIFTIVMDQLRLPDDANRPRDMKRSLYFQGIVALVLSFTVLFYNSKNLRLEAETAVTKRNQMEKAETNDGNCQERETAGLRSDGKLKQGDRSQLPLPVNMCSDGYVVAEQELNPDMDYFRTKCVRNGKVSRDEMMFQVQKSDNPTEQLLVTFPNEKTVGVKYLKQICTKMVDQRVSRGIIVYQGTLTSAANKAIQSLNQGISDRGPDTFTYELDTFSESELLVNITEHQLVPHHTLLTDEEKKALLKRYRLKETQLPRIQITDPVARYYGLKRGQ